MCVYCNIRKATIKDHIPPKCFYPKPQPNNLITVPCCEECNKKYGQDDEYFRSIIVMKNDIYDNENAKQLFEKVIKSFQRKEAVGFKKSILESLEVKNLFSKSGIYLGKIPTYQVDNDRIRNFLKRIALGLYSIHFKKNYTFNKTDIRTYLLDDINKSDHKSQTEILKNIIIPFEKHNTYFIGNTSVFRYKFINVKDKADFSVWLLSFYENFFALVLLGPFSEYKVKDDKCS